MKPNSVTISHQGDKIHVVAPYNPTFITRAKQLGGRWIGGVWAFHAGSETNVRALCIEIFGTDQAEYTSITIRVDATTAWRKSPVGNDAVLYIAGREVLSRRHRDAAIRVGTSAGVAVVAGTLPASGGSMRYPSLGLDDGVIIEVYDVPKDHPGIDADYIEIITKQEPTGTEESATAVEKYAIDLIVSGAESATEDDTNESGAIDDALHGEAVDLAFNMLEAIKGNPRSFAEWVRGARL